MWVGAFSKRAAGAVAVEAGVSRAARAGGGVPLRFIRHVKYHACLDGRHPVSRLSRWQAAKQVMGRFGCISVFEPPTAFPGFSPVRAAAVWRENGCGWSLLTWVLKKLQCARNGPGGCVRVAHRSRAWGRPKPARTPALRHGGRWCPGERRSQTGLAGASPFFAGSKAAWGSRAGGGENSLERSLNVALVQPPRHQDTKPCLGPSCLGVFVVVLGCASGRSPARRRPLAGVWDASRSEAGATLRLRRPAALLACRLKPMEPAGVAVFGPGRSDAGPPGTATDKP